MSEVNEVNEVDEVIKHVDIVCDHLASLLKKKNADYGDSYKTNPMLALGIDAETAMAIRIGDKVNRLKNLMRNKEDANYESANDTLIDIAGYCICWLSIRDRYAKRDIGECDIFSHIINHIKEGVSVSIKDIYKYFNGWMIAPGTKVDHGLISMSMAIRYLHSVIKRRSECKDSNEFDSNILDKSIERVFMDTVAVLSLLNYECKLRF